jgi:site-specific DNA-methyltransferase (adenine-specific)
MMDPTQQFDLFGKNVTKTLSIEESATRAQVSTATIRNWIKTGYLVPAGPGQITIESLIRFQSEIAGREKLTKRANKSLKDEHDHLFIRGKFIEKLENEDFAPETLGIQYESSLSDSYRNKEGIYYTPSEIVRSLFNNTTLQLETATFCDPCCGSGNFVSQALALGFRPQNIYAYDIDPVAVAITSKRILIESGYKTPNIKTANFLDVAVSSNHPTYDCIFTNPPWGTKTSKEDRESFGHWLRAGESIDSCSLFFFASLNCLNTNGELGLLLPESFFNVGAYEAARIKALEYSIKRVIDYGKAFRGLITKAHAIVLEKTPIHADLKLECIGPKARALRKASSFKINPKAIFNHHCSQESAEVISNVFSIPHRTLKGLAKWGLGIVTGNNTRFTSSHFREGLIPVFKGSDIISKDTLKEASTFIPNDFTLYQQVASLDLYRAKDKLIYKFISSKLCFFHDSEQRFILNSANMLIPDERLGVPLKVLNDLLSSEFMNWLFSEIFNTHKVLRGDLEALPIHSQFLRDAVFNENDYLVKLGIIKTNNGTYRIKG